MRPILDVAADLSLPTQDLVPYGRDKLKLPLALLDRPRPREGRARLVLVSAITPTPAGEGKTTTSIGLGQALRHLGESVCLALREPSLGPCFGIKGGGTGGGQCTVEPKEEINLHFTGDFHAISAAHNLLAAAIDNSLHFGNPTGLDPRRITWPRVVDMNDRALRRVVIGTGGPTMGMPREGQFDITAASEIMAIMGLATDLDDLRARLDRILVGFTRRREPVYAASFEVTGAMVALLKDAIEPNLVQTADGTPAVVHGGPFANIAHGCNSILATRMAMHHADWTITEAGFAFDLGGEKFLDIKARLAGLTPDCVVVVATVRALKWHGGADKADLAEPSAERVRAGLSNLERHLDSVEGFGARAVVAINRFADDSDEELDVIRAACSARGVPVALADHFARGAEGAIELAREVMKVASSPPEPLRFTYDLSDPLESKIRAVAQKIYGADDIELTTEAQRDLRIIDRIGRSDLPICMAKTAASVSDDPKLRGRPTGFTLTVRQLALSAGAGFVVVLTGDILRMPGLPRRPSAADVDLVDGRIVGVG
ncbi:MAG: formate--tetrahydrofolate ligase [Deltaproteobacteria bacterium]|nr:MAG: formate--tetrahydrofolate ligase [Deltaproteobacteria bacterium]